MALLDRVKERIETDLTDGELNLMIAEQQAEITKRYGATGEITVDLSGRRRAVDLIKPLDQGETITVLEFANEIASSGSGTTLLATEYRVLNAGRTIQRLDQDFEVLVRVTYTPTDDQAQRDEITIKLVQLAIQYEALTSDAVGDSTIGHVDQHNEREMLLSELSPRTGLFLK